MSCQPVAGDLQPVVRDIEPLPHDAPVGAMQAERHLDVVGAVAGDEPEDVTDLVHGLGGDALALGAGIQFQEPVNRDDCTESLNCEADAETAVVIVEIRVGHHDVVMRRRLLPRLVVEQLEEVTAVQLVVVPTGSLRVRNVPVDTVPVGEGLALEPTRTAPHAKVVNLDVTLDTCDPEDRLHRVEHRL